MNIGVFSCDPGGSTGLAWAILDPNADLVESLRGRMNAGSATITGDISDQIRAIAGIWRSFFNACVWDALLPPENIWYVCEDFIYTGANYSGESAKISTALIYGIEGYRMGRADQWAEQGRGRRKNLHMPAMVLQPASQVMTFSTDKRLREWELWVVGRDHERSAFKHLAFFLKRYQIQHGK